MEYIFLQGNFQQEVLYIEAQIPDFLGLKHQRLVSFGGLLLYLQMGVMLLRRHREIIYIQAQMLEFLGRKEVLFVVGRRLLHHQME
jgi:hypothetical protein